MQPDDIPPPLRALLRSLEGAVQSREPAIRAKVEHLRGSHPLATNQELARLLIRSTRRRVAGTGALSGAAAIAPGLGTVLAIGTVTSQAIYALEQEIELVLGVAMIYGHDLGGSEGRVMEALVVVGVASGAVKLREAVLVAGGQRLAARVLARVVSRTVASRASRLIQLGVGIAVGAGFDWVTVTALGRAAIRYYGPGGPGSRPRLLAAENSPDVEIGH
jgi:hypothetical protein